MVERLCIEVVLEVFNDENHYALLECMVSLHLALSNHDDANAKVIQLKIQWTFWVSNLYDISKSFQLHIGLAIL